MTSKLKIVEKFLLRSDSIVSEQVIPLYDQEAIAGVVTQTVEDLYRCKIS